MHDPRRILSFPDLLNARDLGGYPTRDGGTTRWRSLLRADDLLQLTSEGLRTLSSYGVRTVVDLRWPGEVAIAAHPVVRDAPHINYCQVSLLLADEQQWRDISAECTKETWKCAVLEHAREPLKLVLQTIAAAEEPLLFHCVAGKDRTGLVAAMLLDLADVLPEAIAYDYALSAQQLRDGYLQRYTDVARQELIELIRCPEEGVYRMRDYLAPFGGVRGFLREIGLTDAEIAALHAKLVD